MQQVIELGRQKREKVKINLRTPLRRLTIIHRDAALLDEIKTLENYLKAELNVKEVRYEQDEASYIALYAKPNFPVLGKRLGRRMKDFQTKIAALDPDTIEAFQEHGTLDLDGESFDAEEIPRVPGSEARHGHGVEPLHIHRTETAPWTTTLFARGSRGRW